MKVYVCVCACLCTYVHVQVYTSEPPREPSSDDPRRSGRRAWGYKVDMRVSLGGMWRSGSVCDYVPQ